MTRYLPGLAQFAAALTMSVLSTAAAQAANPGEPLGPVFTVTEDIHLQEVKTAPLPNGGVLILWQSRSFEPTVTARAFNADGTPRTGEFVLEGFPSHVNSFSLATNSLGQFVVATIDNGARVMVRRFSAAGAPLGVAQVVDTGPASTALRPAVGLADSGDFVVAWYEADYRQGSGIYDDCEQQNLLSILSCWVQVEAVVKLRRYVGGGLLPQSVQSLDHAGSFWIQVSPGQELAVGAAPQTPSLSMTPSGRFTIAWWRDANPDTLLALSGIYARSYSMNGQSSGPRQWVSQENGQGAPPSVSMNASGAYVVAYQRIAQNNESALFARSYSAPTLLGLLGGGATERVVSRDTTARQPIIGVDANGNYVIAWNAHDADLQRRMVIFQRYSRDGSPLGQPVGVGELSNTSESRPQYDMARHPTGQFTVVWAEQPAITTKVLKARSFAGP